MKTKFKKGDRVFSYSFQEFGTVKDIYDSEIYQILVEFPTFKLKEFTSDGRRFTHDKAPDLFFDEVTIEPPKKPLEDKDIVMCWDYEQNFFRGYYFYDSKNKCVFFSNNGLRNGERFDNMVYVPDEEAPQDLVFMRDKLED